MLVITQPAVTNLSRVLSESGVKLSANQLRILESLFSTKRTPSPPINIAWNELAVGGNQQAITIETELLELTITRPQKHLTWRGQVIINKQNLMIIFENR